MCICFTRHRLAIFKNVIKTAENDLILYKSKAGRDTFSHLGTTKEMRVEDESVLSFVQLL